MLPGEPDPAVHLEAGRHDPAPGVGAPHLGRRRRARRVAVAGPHRPGRVVRRGSHALDVDEHVGAAVLDGLEAADGLTELDPVLGVLGGHLEDAGRGPQHLAAQGGGGAVQERPGRLGAAQRQGGAVVQVEPAERPGAVHGRFGRRPFARPERHREQPRFVVPGRVGTLHGGGDHYHVGPGHEPTVTGMAGAAPATCARRSPAWRAVGRHARQPRAIEPAEAPPPPACRARPATIAAPGRRHGRRRRA